MMSISSNPIKSQLSPLKSPLNPIKSHQITILLRQNILYFPLFAGEIRIFCGIQWGFRKWRDVPVHLPKASGQGGSDGHGAWFHGDFNGNFMGILGFFSGFMG